MSRFLEFARIIKVEDVCRSFMATYNAEENSTDVVAKFQELLSEEDRYTDEEMALVKSDNQAVGYFDLLCLNVDNLTISEVMYPFEISTIFSAETDILTVVECVSKLHQNVFFVNRGNEIIGYFFFDDLLGDPLFLSVLAMIMEFERICLSICCLDPETNFRKLSNKSQNNIRSKYINMGYFMKEDGNLYYLKAMEVSSLKEKIYILLKDRNLMLHIPGLKDNVFIKKTYDFRNFVVHPTNGKALNSIFKKNELWPFIKKLESLTSSLRSHYEEMIKINTTDDTWNGMT